MEKSIGLYGLISYKSCFDWFLPDGKTVTTRKVETVSKSAGVGGTSYGKPAGKHVCELCVLIEIS